MRELQKFARFLAEKSAEAIRPYFRTSLPVDYKSDESPVTIADRKAEEVMRELIMKELPDHGIIGEEFGSHNPGAEFTWVLDPIDGTKTFVCGGFMWGTLIALTKDSRPILGIIHQPILRELLLGSGFETTLNGAPVKVRSCTRISDATLLTSDPYMLSKYQNGSAFETLLRRVKIYRCCGDCYGYLLLATGQVDVMIDPIMNPWDVMALIPIVLGAGGAITDYQGGSPAEGTSAIATAGEIHNRIITLLNSPPT